MRSLTAFLVLASLAVAAGCSSKEEKASSLEAEGADGASGWKGVAATSGTRLRARFVTAGAARELVGFHDSERNEDCTFQPAETGHTRCLPTSVPAVQGAGFSDAACQIPLASVPTCPADVKYAINYRYDQGGCGQTAAEIRKVVAGTTNRYALGPTGCTLQPGSSTLATLAALGDVVPWTAFVEATETVVAGDAVAEKVLVASDGARQHVGFRLQQLDVDCTFQLMPDGVTRCVPEAFAGAVIYTDSDCTKPAFVNDYQSTSTGPCSKPKTSNLWLEPSIGTCGAARAVYSLQESHGGDVGPSDSSELYTPQVRSTGTGTGTTSVTCTSMGTRGGYSQSRRGIDANITSTLPTASRISKGDGRLVPALVASPSNGSTPAPVALAIGWHDNEKDADCTFELASDGKLRCLPTGAAATIFFTDSKCTSPSRVAVVGEVPCAGGGKFARVTSTTCPPTTRVYALGTERRNLTNVSAETSPGRCPSVQGVNNALDATEADPAGFVEGVTSAE